MGGVSNGTFTENKQKMSKYTSEFNTLFLELTGIKPQHATKGTDGFYFIPQESSLNNKDASKRHRISLLAGPNGWRNHLVNGKHAGWWVLSPEWNKTLLTNRGINEYEKFLQT